MSGVGYDDGCGDGGVVGDGSSVNHDGGNISHGSLWYVNVFSHVSLF